MDDREMTLPGGDRPGTATNRKIESKQKYQEEYTESCVYFTEPSAPVRRLRKHLDATLQKTPLRMRPSVSKNSTSV